MNGSYTLPWDISASANFNAIEGASRTTTINGPGAVYGGVNAAGAATTISQTTLEFEPRGTHAVRSGQAARSRRAEGLPLQAAGARSR